MGQILQDFFTIFDVAILSACQTISFSVHSSVPLIIYPATDLTIVCQDLYRTSLGSEATFQNVPKIGDSGGWTAILKGTHEQLSDGTLQPSIHAAGPS